MGPIGWLLAIGVACGDATDPGTDTTGPTDSSDTPPTTETPPTSTDTPDCTPVYSGDWAGVEQLFVDHCDSCHPSVAGFDLHVDVAADVTNGTGYFVVPGDAASSLLWKALVGLSLTPMPIEGTLPCDQVAHVEAWINAGAGVY